MPEEAGEGGQVTFPASWLCDVPPKHLKLSGGGEGPAKMDH